jgi:membrane protein
MRIPESRALRLLFEVSRRSIRKYLKHDDMPSYAAALAYRTLFALFPFLTVLVALLAFLGSVSFFDWLIEQAYAALQEQYARLGEWLIEQIQYESQGELLVLTIGIALWSVSSSVRTLTKALNAVHEVEESRPSWKRYPLSFFYALGLAIMVILAAALLLIGPKAVEWVAGLVELDEVFVSLWTWLRLPVALVLIMLSVSIIYWALPNVNHPYRLITPGAALAVIAWVIASLGFSFYLANFSNYSVIYGSIGAAFILLLYFYISAAVLLMGAELNAAIYYYASDRNTQEEEEEEERRTGHETPDAETRSRPDV